MPLIDQAAQAGGDVVREAVSGIGWVWAGTPPKEWVAGYQQARTDALMAARKAIAGLASSQVVPDSEEETT